MNKYVIIYSNSTCLLLLHTSFTLSWLSVIVQLGTPVGSVNIRAAPRMPLHRCFCEPDTLPPSHLPRTGGSTPHSHRLRICGPCAGHLCLHLHLYPLGCRYRLDGREHLSCRLRPSCRPHGTGSSRSRCRRSVLLPQLRNLRLRVLRFSQAVASLGFECHGKVGVPLASRDPPGGP